VSYMGNVGSDIVAKSIYCSGELSEYGKKLYETSPNGGPNKNPYSGIQEKAHSPFAKSEVDKLELDLESTIPYIC
jgi:hypothetical protein